MIIEQEICRRVAEAFKAVLPGIEVEGNFLPDDAGAFKGMEVYSPGKFSVTVGARSYSEYTSRVATVPVTLSCEIPVEADMSLDLALSSFGAVMALLEEWHGSIAAVKRDLAVEDGFDPVGLRLAGGDFEVSGEEKTRRFSQSFEVQGRMTSAHTPKHPTT